MRQYRIALVSLNTRDTFSLALGYIHSYLKKKIAPDAADIRIFNVFLSDQGAAGRIMDFQPDIVAFSCYVWNIAAVGELAARIRNEGMTIVLGGPEVSDTARDVLEKIPSADIIVRGEGEATFSELISHYAKGRPDLSEIKGITYRSGMETIQNDARPLIEDLDSIPSPYLTGIIRPEDIYFEGLVEVYRGCIFRCGYCYESKNYRKVRHFSAERVAKEMEFLIGNGIKKIYLMCATLNQDKGYLSSLAGRVDAIGISSGVEITADIKAEGVDEEICRLLAKCRITTAGIGLQSTSEETNRNCGRCLDLEKFSKGLALLRSHGFRLQLHTIMGLPGDNFFRYSKSLRYVIRQDPYRIYDFLLNVLPGTGFRNRSGSYCLDYDQRPPYNVKSSNSFPGDEIDRVKLMSASIVREYSARP